MILIPILFILIWLGVVVLMIVSQWRVFVKAEQPGWASIVPFYNFYILCEIARKPTWWFAMMFIPIANIVFLIKILNGVSKAFGKDEGFTAGLFFLGFVFWPILAFSDAKYIYDEQKSSNELLDS